MIAHEDADLSAKVKALLISLGAEDSPYRALKVNIVRNDAAQVLLEFTDMYETPCQCDEALLEAVRELVGAGHVEHFEDIAEGGCESCDYGSRYGFAVRCW